MRAKAPSESRQAQRSMEIFRSLGALLDPPTKEGALLADLLGLGPLPDTVEQADVFLFQLYPYASVYLGSKGMMGGQARDRIAGFWRALEIAPVSEVDHLSVMLAFYTRLAEFEAAAQGSSRQRWHHAKQTFLWEHLLSWMPIYLQKLEEIAPPFYRSWAELLATALRAEALEMESPPLLPLHLRSAPDLIDPREGGGEEFLDSLLAPVRSGFVLVRRDLERAGRELGLAVRTGERRLTLRGLLAQDEAATLIWLGGEAGRWAERHRLWESTTRELAGFWARRAAATAALLGELRADL